MNYGGQTAVKLPARYSAMRKALADATKIEPVKEIKDKAEAVRSYAFRAKDADLGAWATEIVKRAIRRVGQLMGDMKQAGALPKGGDRGGRKPKAGLRKNPAILLESLGDLGIDKNLAHQARKHAAMSDAEFEEFLADMKAMVVAAILANERAGISAAREKRHRERKAKRATREKELAKKQKALPVKVYGVIYADPEWKFDTYSEKGKAATSAENHYPTSELEAIKERKVEAIAAKDSVLFLWATVPMLPQALEVMAAWGFKYVSNLAWVKDRPGTGYWFSNKHELLLVGKRGQVPAPAQGEQYPSVIEAKRGRHSEKPEVFYEIIEKMFPNLPKVELNARKARPGWDRWGLESDG